MGTTSKLRIKLKFIDGSTLETDSYEDAEQGLRDLQFVQYDSKEEFRKEMAHRAEVWSGTEVMTTGSSEDFLYELERAQFFSVSRYYTQGDNQ